MEYNFDKIQDADYCCEMCFLENIIEEYSDLNPEQYEFIAVVAQDYLAQDLFRMLSSIKCGCGEYLFNFGLVEFNDYEYEGEYIISVTYDGVLSLKQMVADKGNYLYTEGKVIFIHEDCNYRAIERLDDGENNIVIFGFDGDCE